MPPGGTEKQTPPLLRLVRAIAIAVLAYFSAAFLFFFLLALSRVPSPYWDINLQEPILFVLLIVTMGVCLIPYFQRDWNPNARMFSIVVAVFLLAYAVFRDSSVIDLDYPLHLVNRYLSDPIRRTLGI